MDLTRRISGFLCVFLLVLAAGGGVARAEAAGGADAVQKVTSLNKKALDDYAKGDFDSARALLKEALELCNTAGLDKHPIKARTHIHLGIVTIVGLNQRALGIKHFKKALEIQPEIKLTKSLSSPELQAAFEEAQGAGEDLGGPAPAAAAPAAPAAEEGGAAPATAEDSGGAPAASGDDEGTPRIRRAPPKKKKKPADEEGGGEGDEEEEGAYHIFLAFTLGSGFGVASGSGELNAMHVLKQAGFAPAQLGQVSPEVGYFVNSSLLLSARLRIQYVSGLTGEPSPTGCGSDNYCTPGNWGIAGFARATYFFGEPGAFRFFVAGEAGGGNIRHAQTFPLDTNCGMAGAKSQCVDSLKSGPFLFGPAIGFMYDFGHAAGLLVSLATDIGVPAFTANFDLNAGLALHF